MILCSLVWLFIFSACAPKTPPIEGRQIKDATTIADEISSLFSNGSAMHSDDDLVEINFPELPPESSGVIYCTNDTPTTEFGVFCAKNTQEAAKILNSVRYHLREEAESKRSIAELYPTPETEVEAERYASALSERSGAVVYYFVGSREDAAEFSKCVLNILEEA